LALDGGSGWLASQNTMQKHIKGELLKIQHRDGTEILSADRLIFVGVTRKCNSHETNKNKK
jgi:hypothetical protein